MKISEFLSELKSLPGDANILMYDHRLTTTQHIGQVYLDSDKLFLLSTPLRSQYSTAKSLIKKINCILATATSSDFDLASGDVFSQTTKLDIQRSDRSMLMVFSFKTAA